LRSRPSQRANAGSPHRAAPSSPPPTKTPRLRATRHRPPRRPAWPRCEQYVMLVSRCRGIGPPSGIPSSGLCFCWLPICVVIQLQTSVPRGVSIIPRAVSLRVYISQSTGILGIPLPALLSNIPILLVLPCILFPQWA